MGSSSEEIRDHFLLQLNGHYHGSATGETFNGAGKTDILVRQEDKTLFIGECKIWRGPASFTDAIDQLFTYLTWRDTKCAIVVFCKNKKFDPVLEAMKTEVENHPQKKSKISQTESSLRYALSRGYRHPNGLPHPGVR
jgi:hypothetical protein